MPDATLMIRVETRNGDMPVEAFLRVARELAFVAAEVGRSLTANLADALPLADALTGSLPDAMPNGWRIVDVQCSGLADGEPNGATADNSGPRAVGLVIAPPAAQWRTAGQVREGIRSIHARCEERPEGFSDTALRALRRVALAAGRQLRVTVSAGRGEGEAVALDANVVAQIDAWLAGQRDALGSVEGMLEIISIHNRLRFTVYEKSSNGREGARIECLFPEAMLAQVKGALGERVCIRGRVRYRKDGIPATVEAHWLRPLRSLTELPSIEALYGRARL